MPSQAALSTFDEEDLTVDDTAGGVRLTMSKYLASPSNAQSATITVETAQIRWKKDATGTLTATTGGHLANVGTIIYLDHLTDLANFRAIRTGASSATLRISYHR